MTYNKVAKMLTLQIDLGDLALSRTMIQSTLVIQLVKTSKPNRQNTIKILFTTINNHIQSDSLKLISSPKKHFLIFQYLKFYFPQDLLP